MLGGADSNDAALIDSMLDWWAQAGVDTAIAETPRDWLKPQPRVAVTAQEAAVVAEVATAPLTLEAVQALRSGPFAVAPGGSVAAGLMFLADMPEPDDLAEGRLLGGPAGRLFDRMLAAIGRERDAVYTASIADTRTPTGRIEAGAMAALLATARHHVALAAPRVLVLLGDTASRAILGAPVAAMRGGLHPITIEGSAMHAIATFHPRTLLQHPLAKAEAWADLRRIPGALAA